MYKNLVVVAGAFLLSACGHDAIVSPLQNGQYDIMSMGASEQYATKDALKGAKETCPNFIVLNKQVRYQGIVNEKTQRTLNNVARVLPPLEMAASGGTSMRYHGNPLRTGEDYVVNLLVSCHNMPVYGQPQQYYGYQPRYSR